MVNTKKSCQWECEEARVLNELKFSKTDSGQQKGLVLAKIKARSVRKKEAQWLGR